MAMFLVVTRRTGPRWNAALPLDQQSDWLAHAAFMDALVDSGFVLLGGPLEDEQRVAMAVEADSAAEVRATLAGDPWSGSHLEIDSIDGWTIRLDGRTA